MEDLERLREELTTRWLAPPIRRPWKSSGQRARQEGQITALMKGSAVWTPMNARLGQAECAEGGGRRRH